MLERSSKMSVREAMIDLGGKPPAYGGQSRWFMKIVESVEGVTFRTVRSLYLGEIKNEDHLAAREIKRKAAIAKAKREAELLAAQYDNIAETLRAKDENFHSTDIAALVHAARIIRGLDSAGNKGEVK